MSKLRFKISMSLNGFVAGPNRSVVPTLLGSGERLFEGVGDDLHGLELVRTVAAQGDTPQVCEALSETGIQLRHDDASRLKGTAEVRMLAAPLITIDVCAQRNESTLKFIDAQGSARISLRPETLFWSQDANSNR